MLCKTLCAAAIILPGAAMFPAEASLSTLPSNEMTARVAPVGVPKLSSLDGRVPAATERKTGRIENLQRLAAPHPCYDSFVC
jgi:hypothetical protein